MPTRVVTDSSCDLPADVATGLDVVPLTVAVGEAAYRDGTELDHDRFWDLLATSPVPPATAPPDAAVFADVYRRLAEEGADEIVSVHLSSRVSDTCSSAREAADGAQVRVVVVDSLAVSAALGLQALHAFEQAGAGAGADAIAASLDTFRGRVGLYATVDTLDYLRRGRRIGGAQALLGTMLQVKPIITLQGGVVEAAGRVRTRRRALEQLRDMVASEADEFERLVVVHGRAPDTDDLVELMNQIAPCRDVWPLGPVVGAHTGPGTIGVVYLAAA